MGTWNFNYDAVDRLTTASAGSNAPTAFQNQNATWSYDSYGNRTAQSFTNGANSNWAYYNSANNRITSASTAPGGFLPDASGNTLYDGTNRYWYDAEGRICAVQNQAVGGLSVTQYVYDAEGARIGKGTLSAAPSSYTATCAPPLGSGFTLTARYLVDLGGDQVTELNTTSGSLAWAHSNVFSAARLTATYDTNGLHYELADPLGTKRIQANISGQVEESWSSLPFGDALAGTQNPALATAGDATEHHFTGKERDTESGNDYFGARYYASSMGRFMSPDWSSSPEPVPYANLENPQSLNLYSYVGNNPLGRRDADGHCAGWLQWLCNAAQSVKNGFEGYGLHTDATVKKNIEAERKWILQGATDQGSIKTINGWDQRKVNDVYKCMNNSACMQALAAAVSTVTQWGWPGQEGYNNAKNQLNKVNTPEGTVDNQTLGGKVPTQDEAVRMIEESGGKVERIEEGHGPDSVSHHDYPHINYTTADGAKGTIQIQSVQQ
jgi:RHS repeat-associated protein